MIRGIASSKKVFINDVELSPEKSQAIINHSPDGFNWGYHGSGPAQLALALLLEFRGAEFAKKFYQNFKFDVISRLPLDKDFEFNEEIVINWDNNANKKYQHHM
jgi:hypothetical protein